VEARYDECCVYSVGCSVWFGLVCVLCVSVCCSVFVCDCAGNVNVWIVIAFVVMCLFVMFVCGNTSQRMQGHKREHDVRIMELHHFGSKGTILPLSGGSFVSSKNMPFTRYVNEYSFDWGVGLCVCYLYERDCDVCCCLWWLL
jgi:hypothetical protein